MEENRGSLNTRITLGIILIIIGGLFLFRSLGFLSLHIPHIIFSWPFVIFIIGLLIAINSQKKTFGYILLIIGTIFLIPRIFPEVYYDSGLIFPLLIIGLGIYVLVRHRTSKPVKIGETSTGLKADRIDDVAIFGGGTKVINSDNFSGGNITAIFGGSEILLNNCKLADGQNVLDILFLFGGSEIIVPNDWNVIISVTPIFGGFSNKIRRSPNVPIDTSRSLIVKGVAIFGGGEVKSY
jgi:predicted membrane protein